MAEHSDKKWMHLFFGTEEVHLTPFKTFSGATDIGAGGYTTGGVACFAKPVAESGAGKI